jgi:uncharacterized protein YjbJ (UPF0337 family)
MLALFFHYKKRKYDFNVKRPDGQKIKTMNKLQIRGNLNVIIGKLKAKYGELTDDDLIYMEGKEDEFLGRLQKKTGKSKEDLMEEINNL